MWETLHNKCTSTIRWRIAASGGDDACAAWLEHRQRVQCSSTAWSEWSVVTWQCIMATNRAPRWAERHDVKTGECEANGIISDQSDSGWLWNRWMSDRRTGSGGLGSRRAARCIDPLPPGTASPSHSAGQYSCGVFTIWCDTVSSHYCVFLSHWLASLCLYFPFFYLTVAVNGSLAWDTPRHLSH